MQFKEIDVTCSEGWTLAHSIELAGKRIAKNSTIDAHMKEAMLAAGLVRIQAYKLDQNDICENTAAREIAGHIAGSGIKVGEPTRGRCNLFASESGLVSPSRDFSSVNTISASVGVATLPALTPVNAGKLIATVKIIPYSIGSNEIQDIKATTAKIDIAPFKPFTAQILATGPAMAAKAISVTQNRVHAAGGEVTTINNCDHTVEAIASKLRQMADSSEGLLLLSGISAISDKRDVLPTALEQAGGKLIHLGMPVDPGNLLMLGEIKGKTVIGLPGCAKSPSLNGFDWVLERFSAGLRLDAEIIQNMGIGGLLKESVERPAPRAPAEAHTIADTPAILLAAGKSTRSGQTHKLLASLDNKPVIEQSVIALKEAGFKDIIVVTGAREKEIKSALSAQQVSFVHNPDFADGMAGSLVAGVLALPPESAQCVICLGDMPFVSPSTYQALVKTANQISEADIFTPVFKGKRGNPVLWRDNQFEKLQSISGDKGGRAVIRENEDIVCEVAVKDPGIMIDLDTPAALAQFGIKVTD